MRNNIKCSIIVPIYNAETYISNCVESVLQLNNISWELILIDDGSTDGSRLICDQYAANDKRVKVYHQINQGVSAARNLGLKVMRGEYVLFLDSDDWIDSRVLELSIKEMDLMHADMLQSPTNRVNNNTTKPHHFEKGNIYNCKDYIDLDSFYVCIGGSIIRSNIITDNQIFFRNDIKLAEDQMFIMDSMRFSCIIYRLDSPFYNYYINDNSATNTSKSISIIESINALVEYKTKYPQFGKSIDYTLLYFIWYVIKNRDVSIRDISRLIKKADISLSQRFSYIEKAFLSISRITPIGGIVFVHLYKSLKQWL